MAYNCGCDKSKDAVEYKECIVDCAERYGYTLTFPQISHNEFAKLKINDMEITLSAGEAGDPQEMEGFLRNVSKVEAVIEDIGTDRKDIFHDEIYRRIKSEFKDSRGSHIAYGAVCEVLQKKGVKIWS